MLRLYLMKLIQKLYTVHGRPFFGQPLASDHASDAAFFRILLRTRFRGLQGLFSVQAESDASLCLENHRGSTPMARFMNGEIGLDVEIVAGHFEAFPADIRDILVADFLEQITAQVVGPRKVLAFWLLCFQGHPFHLAPGSLWDTLVCCRAGLMCMFSVCMALLPSC